MPRTGFTAEELRARALDATLAQMRRHGFERVRLSDVARELGISHAALYAHFDSKAALLDAVTERWLADEDAKLWKICASPGEPVEKLRAWFVARHRVKVDHARHDPEVYRSFDFATAEDKPFIQEHRLEISRQLERLLAEAGVGTGQDGVRILIEAMAAFLHPSLVARHLGEDREGLISSVLDTVLAGLGIGLSDPPRSKRRPHAAPGSDATVLEVVQDD